MVSSSANCHDILVAAGIEDLFEARIDGVTAKEEHLPGKPAPDTFLAGARALGLRPSEAAVYEDALAGVAAGQARIREAAMAALPGGESNVARRRSIPTMFGSISSWFTACCCPG